MPCGGAPPPLPPGPGGPRGIPPGGMFIHSLDPRPSPFWSPGPRDGGIPEFLAACWLAAFTACRAACSRAFSTARSWRMRSCRAAYSRQLCSSKP